MKGSKEVKDMIDHVFTLSKTERLTRLCKLSAKLELGLGLTDKEACEMAAIQTIRQLNGELDAESTKRAREQTLDSEEVNNEHQGTCEESPPTV